LIFEQLLDGAEKVLSWDIILGSIAQFYDREERPIGPSIQDFTMWRAGAPHIV